METRWFSVSISLFLESDAHVEAFLRPPDFSAICLSSALSASESWSEIRAQQYGFFPQLELFWQGHVPDDLQFGPARQAFDRAGVRPRGCVVLAARVRSRSCASFSWTSISADRTRR